MKEFINLTDSEVKQIVTDIFHAKRVENIQRNRNREEITCDIYSEWGDDKNPTLARDTIQLSNPFDYGEDAIIAPFQDCTEDLVKLKQFCFAKGIYGASIDWLIHNPYMAGKGENKSKGENR